MGVVFLRPMGNLDPRDPITKVIRFIIWMLLFYCVLALVAMPFVLIYLLVWC